MANWRKTGRRMTRAMGGIKLLKKREQELTDMLGFEESLDAPARKN